MVFIDTEVSPASGRVQEYGAVSDDGAELRTRSAAKFHSFVEGHRFVCGHNILGFDLNWLHLGEGHTYVDTLPLSPLLFPRKPYHRLLKDDKLQADEMNNPVNDAKKARDLFHDEVAAWQALPRRQKDVYRGLLARTAAFSGFLDYVGEAADGDATAPQEVARLVAAEYKGRVCASADLAKMAEQHPTELAYALAVIGSDGLWGLTPAWVMRNHPKVGNVMSLLRNKPCGRCDYCRGRLDPHNGLRDFFGYDQFRSFDGVPMQQQAVEAAIAGKSLLAIFPTGGGKSLTFQLPALMAGRSVHGLTVVVSPLQSLMKDQVDNLARMGIEGAVTINGLLDPIERKAAMEQVADGTASLLYIAPEMLRSRTIERLLLGRNVVRFVVDEAHCFSAWGQDFRTDYLYIGDFIQRLQQQRLQRQPIAVSCFTATAKKRVVSDICDYFKKKLGLELKVFAARAERDNLHYSVLHAETDDAKYSQLRSLILGHDCPTIVYVSRTKRCEELGHRLVRDGIAARPYHGQMDAAVKVDNQNAFMSGEVQVIVATSAFGMGVDKHDVGLVVHYDISDSLESYIQEAGRAGRDPQTNADCYVLFSDGDLDKHFILLNQTKLSISEIQHVWKAIRDLTARRVLLSCSPLEIARQAGWADDNKGEMETRVRSAVTALEQAGFVKRENNVPHILATGIKVRNMDEARQRLEASHLFDSGTREEAVRIIRHLISNRAAKGRQDVEAESRVDYLADILGMTREAVMRSVNLMKQEGLLADTQDMHAIIEKDGVARRLEEMLGLEMFLIKHVADGGELSGYKQLNAKAQEAGYKRCTVKKLRTLLLFLSAKGYMRKTERSGGDSIGLRLLADKENTLERHSKRAELCRFVAADIAQRATDGVVTFSMVDLMERHNTLQHGLLIGNKTTLADMEEALLYLGRTGLLKIEGGFMVSYNTMQLSRQVERTRRYVKEHYRLLDEFYRQRVQQIHIVGEYANLMVRDYDAALRFVSDYFTMDYREFIGRYFKGERKMQITKNISPHRYDKLFGSLSQRQHEIIDDRNSKTIVVAAGPGSGKTRVLVHKLASLLMLEDVKHEQLLMLTFSRAAATEFKTRLIELVGNAAHFVDIKTFHSFSFDLLGRQGSLEDAKGVVGRAAEMIERGEAEESKITKSVLVIDEAQDMGDDDFRLVLSLMRHNEEMRVVAVGDDDQNIYAFRGSDSRHMRSLITDHGAVLYQLTDNYRSDRAIVAYANAFARNLPDRMKSTPITAVSHEEGIVVEEEGADLSRATAPAGSTTAYLTVTNEQALLVAGTLRRQGLNATLVQSSDGFKVINLAEVRYFMKKTGTEATVGRGLWDEAKRMTEQAYATSSCLDVVRRFWHDFEATHHTLYRSDLREFALESDISDFVTAEQGAIFVSTIHKSKGREFDTVHLFLGGAREMDADMMRAIYVGMTRARHSLHIYKSELPHGDKLVAPLSMHDVRLDYFRDRKETVLRLRSGDPLTYSMGMLYNQHGEAVASLSSAMRKSMDTYTRNGFSVERAEVSYILAWRPREEPAEVAVCLANLYLNKNTQCKAI
ncbi:MAG: RecQ family ATP-dependent DNA helicase [Bacteroidales bacterium]|nr:RecQ family ATP-dependent DNA helicase [Bacteroidales bacterium]